MRPASFAQEWTYRFFGACVDAQRADSAALARFQDLPAAKPVAAAEPTTKQVRAWARAEGIDVPDRGKLRPDIWELYRAANGPRG